MDESQVEGDPFARLLARLVILPIAIFAIYLDSQSEGNIGREIFDFLQHLWDAFFYVLGIASLIFAGVAATGRLKSKPDMHSKDRALKPKVHPVTFLVVMAYVGAFGFLYFSQAEIGGVALGQFSGFTNALLFTMPIWTIICVSRYQAESEKCRNDR